jgi:hypothetical protein
MHAKPLESITIHPLVEEVAETQAQVGWHQNLRGESCPNGSRLKNNTTEENSGQPDHQCFESQGAQLDTFGNGQSHPRQKRTREIWMTDVITTRLQQWLNF